MTTGQILVVDDEADIRTLIEEILSDEGYTVRTAGDAASARNSLGNSSPDLVLLDIWMPDTDGITLLKEWQKTGEINCPVVIMSGHGTVETAVEATRLGAVDFIEKPLSLAKLLRTVESALERGKTAKEGLARSMVPPMLVPVGKGRRMQQLRERLAQIAPSGAPVLISGDTGSECESFARYIHMLSKQADKQFVAMVSAATTDENAAELLFGTEDKDQSQRGYLEKANGGTLFISDLEDMAPEAQRLLIGVMEQGGFCRPGGVRRVPLDVRLIGSTKPDDRRGLRSDLQLRFSVLKIDIPPLRDYAEDVPELLQYFVDKLVDTQGLPFRHFSVAAQNRLRNYPWPGNIREMSNLVQRLLIAGGAEVIELAELEKELAPITRDDEPLIKQDLLALPLREAREQFERAYLRQQLSLCGGKVGKLAKRVGMERTHLYRKLRSLGVEFGRE